MGIKIKKKGMYMKRKIIAIVYGSYDKKTIGCIEEKEKIITLQYNNGKKISFESLVNVKEKLPTSEIISRIEPYDATRFSPWMLDHV